jgi:hypothetical protein
MVDKTKLAGLELFEGLSDEALRTIAALSKEMHFAPGAIIFSPEQSSKWIYLLAEGSVRLTVFSSPLPEPMTIAVLTTPGQAFGFSSVVGQGHHNSSAEAVTAGWGRCGGSCSRPSSITRGRPGQRRKIREKELPLEGRKLFERFVEIEQGHQAIVQAEMNAVAGNGYWFDMPEISMES